MAFFVDTRILMSRNLSELSKALDIPLIVTFDDEFFYVKKDGNTIIKDKWKKYKVDDDDSQKEFILRVVKKLFKNVKEVDCSEDYNYKTYINGFFSLYLKCDN